MGGRGFITMKRETLPSLLLVSYQNNHLCHKDVALKQVTLPVTKGDVSELLISKLSKEMLEEWQCLLKLS